MRALSSNVAAQIEGSNEFPVVGELKSTVAQFHDQWHCGVFDDDWTRGRMFLLSRPIHEELFDVRERNVRAGYYSSAYHTYPVRIG